MRRLHPHRLRLAIAGVLVASLAAAVGCASLIGADFDGAQLAGDASADGNPGLDADPDAVPSDAPTLADGGPFDALAVGDLQLWLAANDGVVTTPDPDAGPIDAGGDATPFDAGQAPPDAVREWSDLSPQGHDGTQSNGVRRPSLVPNALAGMPVVHFQRARQTCLRAAWDGGLSAKALTIFAVTRGDPSSLLRFQGGIAPGAVIFPYNSRIGFPDAAPELNVYLYNPPEYRLVRVDHNEAAWQITTTRVVVQAFGGVETWRNGLLSEKSSFFAALPAVDVLGIGCLAGAAVDFADADVAEILVYGSAVSDPDRVAVERYLATKWKL